MNNIIKDTMRKFFINFLLLKKNLIVFIQFILLPSKIHPLIFHKKLVSCF